MIPFSARPVNGNRGGEEGKEEFSHHLPSLADPASATACREGRKKGREMAIHLAQFLPFPRQGGGASQKEKGEGKEKEALPLFLLLASCPLLASGLTPQAGKKRKKERGWEGKRGKKGAGFCVSFFLPNRCCGPREKGKGRRKGAVHPVSFSPKRCYWTPDEEGGKGERGGKRKKMRSAPSLFMSS